MMKLKSRQKSLVSSLKKVILKLKEKAVLCAEQSKTSTQSYNEITDISTKETTTDLNVSFNFLDFILTIKRSIQQKKNTIVRLFYSTIFICKTIKVRLLTSIFDPIPKYNTQTHSIYHRKRLFIQLGIFCKMDRQISLYRLISFFAFM